MTRVFSGKLIALLTIIRGNQNTLAVEGDSVSFVRHDHDRQPAREHDRVHCRARSRDSTIV
jgi:hypothetical protein